MPSFKAPQYTKVTNPKTRVQEPCYTFGVEFQDNEQLISLLIESESEISLQTLQRCVIENVSWWNNFIGLFLQASTKLFSKTYTVENINKITKHTLDGTKSDKFPANITFIPKNIQIFGGVFTVNWGYILESVLIDIPDLNESESDKNPSVSLPATNVLIEGMEELNIDELPVNNNITEEALDLDSPTKFYEKQKVKEARLKAKLALYKAQRQMAQYYEKYGDDISDSDSEIESSDEETDEEVQL